jgi:hypothetical protein
MTLTKISRQRLTDVGEQRYGFYQAAFAMDDNLSGPPVDIVELKKDDFPGSQSESGEQQQDRAIATASKCRLVRSRDYSIDFIWR